MKKLIITKVKRYTKLFFFINAKLTVTKYINIKKNEFLPEITTNTIDNIVVIKNIIF